MGRSRCLAKVKSSAQSIVVVMDGALAVPCGTAKVEPLAFGLVSRRFLADGLGSGLADLDPDLSRLGGLSLG